MDPSNRTLESMIVPVDPSQLGEYSQVGTGDDRPSKRRGVDDSEAVEVSGDDTEAPRETLWDAPREEPKGREIAESACEFTSIRELRKECKKKGHSGKLEPSAFLERTYPSDLGEIMTKHAFVGIADKYQCLSLIQHSTKLFLVNHASLG